jgi:hypothetical protein
MPVYTFELGDGDRRIEDGSGVNLPDHEHAFDYALDIARELMDRREAQTRAGAWTSMTAMANAPSNCHSRASIRRSITLPRR